jgi:Rrf2 family protein
MLTMKTQYALKALVELAQVTGDEPLLIATLSERANVPLKFLQLILRDLKKHGLLRSRKGPGGGYALAKPAETVSLSSVLRMLEGPLEPLPCVNPTRHQRCPGCTDERTCGLRRVLGNAHHAALRVLETRTLADLAPAELTQAELTQAEPPQAQPSPTAADAPPLVTSPGRYAI